MIACGGHHTIIQNEKNEIYVCGWNYYGQLGLSDRENRENRENRDKFEKVEYDFGKIKNITCGEHHTIIQNKKNEIYVCGHNEYGQLGLGDYKNRDKFEKVKKNFSKIKNIACGSNYTIIQNEKNEIYVCGHNEYGQLGLGDNKRRNKFEKVEHNFGEIKNIACGSNHIVIQNKKNEVYVCGYNECGQLGLGDYENRNKFEKVEYNFGEIKKMACGGFHTIIQNEKNEIYVCGRNYYGQLGLGGVENRDKFEKVEKNFGEIIKIACGDMHTVILNKQNEIYVSGFNKYGQLGLGDKIERYMFEKIECELGEIKYIECGENHTVIQDEKNAVYVCGQNWQGQLGLGHVIDRKKFEKVNTDDIFEKIYNFELRLNTEEIVL